MTSFRKQRALQAESFGGADTLEVVEAVDESLAANVGVVEKDDQQVMGLLNEGELLAEDTDQVEAIEEQVEAIEESGEEMTPEHAETVDLITEGICSRWTVEVPSRKQTFEGFSGRRGATKLVRESLGETVSNLWKTFIEWAQGIIDGVADTYKSYFGVGKGMVSAADKHDKVLSGLGAKKEEKVKAKYQASFTIDGQVDEAASIGMANSLPTDAKAVFDWTTEVSNNAKESIVLAQSKDNGKFDQLSKAGKMTNLFGKKLSKKLAPVGPKDSGEMQEIFGLPGNGYIQSFSYTIKQGEVECSLDGLRFISGSDSASEAGEKEVEVSTLAIDALVGHSKTLRNIGTALSTVETNHKGVRAANKELLDLAKKVANAAKGEEDEGSKARLKLAQKVARESVFTSRHSLMAVLSVYKVVGTGINSLLKVHASAYSKA